MEKKWDVDFEFYVDIAILLLKDKIFDYSSKKYL
jgi:hypothetical protein